MFLIADLRGDLRKTVTGFKRRAAILSQSVNIASTVPALHHTGDGACSESAHSETMTASSRMVPQVFSDMKKHSLKTG